MAKFGTVRNGYIEVNGVNLSADCESFTLNIGTQTQPFNAHSDTTAYNTPGLFTWSLSARFYHDFASAKVHATIKTMHAGRGLHNVVVREDSGAASSTNPSYSGLAFVEAYNTPVGGAHGANGMTDVTWSPAGALTELTS